MFKKFNQICLKNLTKSKINTTVILSHIEHQAEAINSF